MEIKDINYEKIKTVEAFGTHPNTPNNAVCVQFDNTLHGMYYTINFDTKTVKYGLGLSTDGIVPDDIAQAIIESVQDYCVIKLAKYNSVFSRCTKLKRTKDEH